MSSPQAYRNQPQAGRRGLATACGLLDQRKQDSRKTLQGCRGAWKSGHTQGCGGRRRLGAISKRGDTYLRMLLTHGARAVLCHAKRAPQPTALQAWALALERHRGHNKAAIALANKLARIVSIWTRDEVFAA